MDCSTGKRHLRTFATVSQLSENLQQCALAPPPVGILQQD